MDDDRPMLAYRPAPPVEPPVGAGPVGCALAAMMTFAVVCLAMLLAYLLPTLGPSELGGMRFATMLGIALITLGGLGWAAVRLGLDPQSRPFGHGIWIGTLMAAIVMALILLGDIR